MHIHVARFYDKFYFNEKYYFPIFMSTKKYKIKLIFIYLKRSEILGCYTKYTKIYDIFCLVHESTYMELNKICFVIFRFFYELLHIYQFSANLKNKRKVNRTNTLHLGPCILVILNVF